MEIVPLAVSVDENLVAVTPAAYGTLLSQFAVYQVLPLSFRHHRAAYDIYGVGIIAKIAYHSECHVIGVRHRLANPVFHPARSTAVLHQLGYGLTRLL